MRLLTGVGTRARVPSRSAPVCQHAESHFRLTVEVWLDDQDAPISDTLPENAPICLKARAICPTCGFDNHFTAYSLTFVAAYHYGAGAWQSWPAWVVRGVQRIARKVPRLPAVLAACHLESEPFARP